MCAPAPPRAEKQILSVIYRKICKCTTTHQVHPQAEQESILGHFFLCGEDLELQLVVLDRLLKATTKKGRQLF